MWMDIRITGNESEGLLGRMAVSGGPSQGRKVGRVTELALVGARDSRVEEKPGWMHSDSQVLNQGPERETVLTARSR